MLDIEKIVNKFDEMKDANSQEHTKILVELGKHDTMIKVNTKNIVSLFKLNNRLIWGFIGLLLAILGVSIKLIAG